MDSTYKPHDRGRGCSIFIYILQLRVFYLILSQTMVRTYSKKTRKIKHSIKWEKTKWDPKFGTTILLWLTWHPSCKKTITFNRFKIKIRKKIQNLSLILLQTLLISKMAQLICSLMNHVHIRPHKDIRHLITIGR